MSLSVRVAGRIGRRGRDGELPTREVLLDGLLERGERLRARAPGLAFSAERDRVAFFSWFIGNFV